ncbi:MAG: hypothetical protein ABIS20_12830 [Thermoanaerobaculia bacterium]
MMTSSSRKSLAVLFALLLASTAVSAEPRGPHRARTVASDSMESFSRFWRVLAGFWTKNGCSLDPSGICLPKATPTENGCSADPDGRCLPTKNGCSADPSGSCLPTAPTKNGCQIDPNGYCIK